MVKMTKTTKKSLKKANMEVKKHFLGNDYDELTNKVQEGFFFCFDDWDEIDRNRIEWVPNAQYALIELFFADYVNYVENSGDWTHKEVNDEKEMDTHFHELLRDRDMYTFKNKKITTITESIKEFKKISYFPPSIVIKDGLFIDINRYFDNVVYF